MVDQPDPKTISSTEASNHFGNMMDDVASGKNVYIVTRMGKPRAVVIGIEQYREIVEQLEILREQNDPEFMAGLAEARQDIELGRTLTLEELDRELGFTDEEIGSQKI
jgi:prevent-host-death family protein